MTADSDFRDLKVAIAHYWFVSWRGGEKVVRALLDLFPSADIYTLFVDDRIRDTHLKGHTVHASILNRGPLRRRYQKIFPLYGIGVESLELQSKYDLLISSESGPIKGIANPDGVPHLCYIHTPMRYCWGHRDEYLSRLPAAIRPVANMAFEHLKAYDRRTIDAPGKYVANSDNVRRRVQRHYGRDASVVYPPIDLSLFDDRKQATVKASERDYYVSFGALTPYKAIDLLVRVFNRLGKQLVVIGGGSERARLEAMASPNIRFVGPLPDGPELDRYLAGAKALVFPGEEDFGMVPLELMARGIPVIALAKGGALETVATDTDHPTGMLFLEQSEDSLIQVLEQFEQVQDDFDMHAIRSHARKFGVDVFNDRMTREISGFLKH